MLKKFELGNEATDYIRSSLSHGLTFAHCLNGLKIKDGRITTNLPEDVSPHRISRFMMGGVTSRAQTYSWIIPLISAHLRRGCEAYAIFEDIARIGHPGFPSPEDKFFSFNSEVYQFLGSNDNDISEIRRAIMASRKYPFIGVLAELTNEAIEIKRGQRLDLYALEFLAAGTRQILIGAYDEEGVLVWDRHHNNRNTPYTVMG